MTKIAVCPGIKPSWVHDAVVEGGGQLCDIAEAQGLVWTDARNPNALVDLLATNPRNLEWIQVPFAGVENFLQTGVFDARQGSGARYLWTCGKGVYAEPVAELALAVLLAGFRNVHRYAQATSWQGPAGRNLQNAHVLILGGGGIAESLVRMLAPFDCTITVLRKSGASMAGVDHVLGLESLDELLPQVDAVVVALSLTPETENVIGAPQLSLMKGDAWVINVGRGRHIDTDALVAALRANEIGGAGMDVTDPEPLPDDHPLWHLENVIITPHIGNTPEMGIPLLRARIVTNIRRFIAGEPLIGPIDLDSGY